MAETLQDLDVPCPHGVMPWTACGDAACSTRYIVAQAGEIARLQAALEEAQREREEWREETRMARIERDGANEYVTHFRERATQAEAALARVREIVEPWCREGGRVSDGLGRQISSQ